MKPDRWQQIEKLYHSAAGAGTCPAGGLPPGSLKNNLSKYLQLVKKGKPVIVTSRNIPLARVTAIPEIEGAGLKRLVQSDWPNYLQVGTTQSFIQRAADLSEAFALRAYDSVHLASADFLLKQSGDVIVFACFDRKLNRAADVLGLSLLDALG